MATLFDFLLLNIRYASKIN